MEGSSQNQVKASQACTIVAADLCVCVCWGGGVEKIRETVLAGWIEMCLTTKRLLINLLTL